MAPLGRRYRAKPLHPPRPPMTSSPRSTAIVLFTHSARTAGAAQPLLAGGVSAFLVRRTARLARKTGLPVFFFSEKQQVGDTFGARLGHAFEQAYARGYERVLAIGHDCPALAVGDLRRAAAALQQHPMVLGPATDGGAWLIGLDRRAFERQRFERIDWQTPRVLHQLGAWATEQALTCWLLDEKTDLDSTADLRRAWAALPIFLQKNLLQLLQMPALPPVVRTREPLNSAFLSGTRPLRAPPA
jgi:uncharacterized protein